VGAVLKLAVIPGAICGGCDVALASVGEKLLGVLKYYEIVYWPIAIDRKLSDLEAVEEIDALIYMGGVSTREEYELARKLSSKSRVKVALGTCSVYGGIPGLNSLSSPLEVYKVNMGKSEHWIQGDSLGLPQLIPYMAYTDVVEPDILAPGCPPSGKVLDQLLEQLIEYAVKGEIEHKPILLGDPESLCNKCPRNPKTTKIKMPGINRLHEVELDDKKCFLEQGILCMGPATRNICDHSCIKTNYPCTGCGGPLEWGGDSGVSMISSIGSILLVDSEKSLLEPGLTREIDKLRDYIGTFYRYTLRKSMLYKLRELKKGGLK
jgi:F420-non-reducing hydrogenase small subunit